MKIRDIAAAAKQADPADVRAWAKRFLERYRDPATGLVMPNLLKAFADRVPREDCLPDPERQAMFQALRTIHFSSGRVAVEPKDPTE